MDEQIKITSYLPAYHWFVVELLTLASIQEYSDCNRTFLEVTFCVNSSISASRSRQLAMSFTNSSLLVRRWVTSVCSWATLSFSLKVYYVFICSHTYSSLTLKSIINPTLSQTKWKFQKCNRKVRSYLSNCNFQPFRCHWQTASTQTFFLSIWLQT